MKKVKYLSLYGWLSILKISFEDCVIYTLNNTDKLGVVALNEPCADEPRIGWWELLTFQHGEYANAWVGNLLGLGI